MSKRVAVIDLGSNSARMAIFERTSRFGFFILREYKVKVRLGEGAYDNCGEIPYSLMYHGITYADEAINSDDKGMMTVRFWNPVMKNGVIDFVTPDECAVKRHIKEMNIKPFGKEHNNFIGLEEFTGGEADGLDG